jgi:hypothetical protein
MNCVLNFVALCVVAEIDDLYAKSLQDKKYKEMVSMPLLIEIRSLR